MILISKYCLFSCKIKSFCLGQKIWVFYPAPVDKLGFWKMKGTICKTEDTLHGA